MPILDKIYEAEQKVEKIKEDAKKEVLKLLEQNEINNNERINQMLDETKRTIQIANEKTSKELIDLEKVLTEKADKTCINDKDNALNHQDEVINEIMRVVID